MSRKRPRQDCSNSPSSNSSSDESFSCQLGCGQVFTLERNRTSHERYTCPLLDKNVNGTPLASHALLGIPDTECRVCGETSSRKDSTKRHERETHGVFFSRSGSTFLPSSLSSSLSYATNKLPQSSPEVEASSCQGETHDSDATLTDVELEVNSANFVFEIPITSTASLATSASPSSDTHPTLTTATAVSVTPAPDDTLAPVGNTAPGDTSALSTTDSSPVAPITIHIRRSADHGNTCPSPCATDATEGSCIAPIIINIRRASTLASPSIDSSSTTPACSTSDSLTCNSCLKELRNLQAFKIHKCHLAPRLQTTDDPLLLQPPKVPEETLKLLEKELSVPDIVKLCSLQNWCLKGYWPLVFPGSGYGAPLLEQYTAGSKSGSILRQLIKNNQIQSLPKLIIIQDKDKNVESLLQESVLRPKDFNFTVGPRDFVVTATVGNTTNGVQTQDGSDAEDDIVLNDIEFNANSSSSDDTSQLPSNTSSTPLNQSSSSGASSNAQEISFESVLPSNMDPGVDDLGESSKYLPNTR